MKILIPYFDDSSLIFAIKAAKDLLNSGHACDVVEDCDSVDYVEISERQFAEISSRKFDRRRVAGLFTDLDFVHDFDAVLIGRPTRELTSLLEDSSYHARPDRPRFMTSWCGLEFTPEKGFRSRWMFDVIFFLQRDVLIKYRNNHDSSAQVLVLGHPYFSGPKDFESIFSGDICFFAQAESPSTLNGRRHIVDLLLFLAKKHPKRRVVLKLRHLAKENLGHVHQEKFSYEELLPKELPSNFVVTAKSIESCLVGASVAITCTSTAAVDALRLGVVPMIYTEFIDKYSDRLVLPMNNLFLGSGLLVDTCALTKLKVPSPSESWLHEFLPSENWVNALEQI